MLYIRYDKPKNQNQNQTEYSAYISFSYNEYYVAKIKELPTRFWISESKEWEIPTNIIYKLKEFENDIKELNQLNSKEVDYSNLSFKTPSYEYQIDGVKYGIENKSWLLGDQQGLGKTKQMIDLAVWRKENEGIKHCLIICGVNNLKYNWLEEIKKHSNEEGRILGFTKEGKEPSMQDRLDDIKSKPKEFFWITNIESLRCHKDGRFYKSEIVDLINEYINKDLVSMIVVDEIHKAKNPASLQARGLLKLKGCSKIGLSGTLLVNKPLDLYVPLSFIGALTTPYFTFKSKYCELDIWGHPVGFKNMNDLKEMMSIHMLRRTKELLNLPEKIPIVEYIEMSKEERKLYKEIITATKKECDKIKNPTQILPKLIRMRQVCCHTSLVSSKVNKSSKFERLRDILEEAKNNNEKVLVFSMFRELIELAVEEFKEFNPLHIWGGMNKLELEEQKNIFQNGEDFNVLFGQINAAGTGHTLTRASIVVFLDLPWNRATMEQAEDRAHRIGTKKSVNIISLLMKDSYDEHLYKMVIDKGDLGEVLIDGKDPKLFNKFIQQIFNNKEKEKK